jgi:hypothetical protein
MTIRTGLLLALTVLVTAPLQFETPATAAQSATGQQNGRKFRATRPIVVDAASGQPRLPDAQELAQVVAQLDALTQRSETLTPESSSSGVMKVDLEGGYGGLMLARPDGAGGFETLCVFTFAEGADFLGLVAEQQ